MNISVLTISTLHLGNLNTSQRSKVCMKILEIRFMWRNTSAIILLSMDMFTNSNLEKTTLIRVILKDNKLIRRGKLNMDPTQKTCTMLVFIFPHSRKLIWEILASIFQALDHHPLQHFNKSSFSTYTHYYVLLRIPNKCKN